MRRYTRNTRGEILAGVCSGLSEYTGIDPLLIRLGFIIFAFIGGLGVILYIALWLLAPKDTEYCFVEDDAAKNFSKQSKFDGSKTKENEDLSNTIEDEAEESENRLKNENAQFRDEGKNKADEIKDRAEEIKNKAEDLKNKTKDFARETSDNIREKTKQGWAWGSAFWGVMIFLLGLLWLGNSLGVFYFRFYYIWRLWPILLCFIGVNMIPMPRILKIFLNILFIIATVAIVLSIGFGCMQMNYSCLSPFWFWD